MVIIGDVHGKVNQYWKIVKKLKENSIQLGDFGFKKEHDWFLKNIDFRTHRINFGNHDDTTYLSKPHSLGDYSFYNDVFTVRGAYSIDKYKRIENKDWWSNEELNYHEMQAAIDYYIKVKPKIVVTHDCPQSVREYFFDIEDKSLTSNGLQVMFENHQPDIWLVGHHHSAITSFIGKTKFICLEELETYTL